MEGKLLRAFQIQVLAQCKYLLMSTNELNAALQANNVEKVFYSIQNLLNAGANISKALWGQKGKLVDQRRLLRESMGITDNSTLRAVPCVIILNILINAWIVGGKNRRDVTIPISMWGL